MIFYADIRRLCRRVERAASSYAAIRFHAYATPPIFFHAATRCLLCHADTYVYSATLLRAKQRHAAIQRWRQRGAT